MNKWPGMFKESLERKLELLKDLNLIKTTRSGVGGGASEVYSKTVPFKKGTVFIQDNHGNLYYNDTVYKTDDNMMVRKTYMGRGKWKVTYLFDDYFKEIN